MPLQGTQPVLPYPLKRRSVLAICTAIPILSTPARLFELLQSGWPSQHPSYICLQIRARNGHAANDQIVTPDPNVSRALSSLSTPSVWR